MLSRYLHRKPLKRKRTQDAPVAPEHADKFRLMALPTELRIIVLRHALVQPQAIPARITIDPSNFDDWKIVSEALYLLQTCKQIREDGLPIFFGENVFEIGVYLVLPERSYILGKRIRYKADFSHLINRIRHFSITIHTHRSYTIFSDDVHDCEIRIHKLCEWLMTYVYSKPISVDISVLPLHLPVADKSRYDREVQMMLEPLTHLRGFRQVDVQGIEEPFKSRLSASMMKEGPVENIWKMRAVVVKWFTVWKKLNRGLEDEFCGALEAWAEYNIPLFKRRRAKLINSMRESLAKFADEMESYDLPEKSDCKPQKN